MATLIVDRLRCLEEHDFFGTDDVYVVYFIGRNPPRASSLHVKGPGSAWGDISTGDVREANVTLDSSYNPENFYMVALIEKDAGKDIAGEEEENVENWMKGAYATFWAASPVINSNLALLMKTQMIAALANNFNGDDDTLLGVRWLKPLTSSGQWRALNYYGDSSHYRIKFLRQ